MFHSQGADLFEFRIPAKEEPVLRSCHQCHAPRGILSVNTRAFEARRAVPPQLQEVDDVARIGFTTAILKQHTYEWGLLQGLWIAGGAP